MKRPRRRIAGSSPRPLAPAQANSVWSYDFVYDACANGQQLKCLTIVDEYTREALAKLISVRGAPRYLRSDNRPEFVSMALLSWVVEQGIETVLIDSDKPWKNGTNESFKGKFRDECPEMEWFRNRLEARMVIEDWRWHYNEVRTHSSLNDETPAAFGKRISTGFLTGAIQS